MVNDVYQNLNLDSPYPFRLDVSTYVSIQNNVYTEIPIARIYPEFMPVEYDPYHPFFLNHNITDTNPHMIAFDSYTVVAQLSSLTYGSSCSYNIIVNKPLRFMISVHRKQNGSSDWDYISTRAQFKINNHPEIFDLAYQTSGYNHYMEGTEKDTNSAATYSSLRFGYSECDKNEELCLFGKGNGTTASLNPGSFFRFYLV